MSEPNPGPRVLVIIPAYNESANIADVITDVHEHVPRAEVAVVDDGSTDDTAERAIAAGARALRMPFNIGVGGAMQTGFQMAVLAGFDLALQVDGDGQHPASEIPKILAPVVAGEVDVVVGTRYLDDRGYTTPAGRRLGQRFFTMLLRSLTGQVFTDTTSGFRAYNREALDFLSRNYARDYPEVNSLVALCHNGFRIREVPVEMRARQGGTSHINLFRAIYYMIKVPLAALMSASRRRERQAP